MLTIDSHVREIDGIYRVGEADISLDSVVIAFKSGYSPETIRSQFPVLSLAEVYGAIAYYLENREEIERYLERQAKLWEELRRQNDLNPSPVIQRLRELRRNGQHSK
jgi:uncharacterized protein (DUF433 family)